VATILFVAGSIRQSANGLVLATQTAFSVNRTQSAVLPTFSVAEGFNEEKGT
jgi:hypothetical protein